jgi:3-oxoadipate enol-lactonase
MPLLDTHRHRTYYRYDGSDAAPVVVLSNALGADLEMWSPQIEALAPHYRVLRYDTRGHGDSFVTPGPYTLDRLGQDVVDLLDQLQVERAHFCGLSMGGAIGQWLALHAPTRVDRLILANTAAKIGSDESWNARIDAVLTQGIAPIVPAILERWFTPGFRSRAPDAVSAIERMLLANEPKGYVAGCAAIRDMDLRKDVARIACPTLVIAGTHDASTPAADSRMLAQSIPAAHYTELDAAHLSNIEQADAFNAALLAFLDAN